MARRYQNQIIDKTESGKRYYPTTIYSQVNPQSSDIYLITVKGDRMDNIAFQYYGDASLWWIIAASNDIPQDSIFIPVGTHLRIPTNTFDIINDYKVLNN